MDIDILISKLMELQKLYPTAYVYFTDTICDANWETYFETVNVDEEANEIEIMFDTRN